MRPPVPPAPYRAAGVALVRAVARPELAVPVWPDLTTAPGPQWLAWLGAVWADEDLAEAMALASPTLASQVGQLLDGDREPAPRDVRRAVVSTAGYLLRAQGRPTPFGLFAGVETAALLGPAAVVRFGKDRHIVARAAAGWLADVIKHLEAVPALLERLEVTANNTAQVRGERLVIPHQPGPSGGAAETTLRHTRPVASALAAATRPVPVRDVAVLLSTKFRGTPAERITACLSELVACRALITALHAPATEPDPLGHLLAVLERAGAGQLPETAAFVTDLRAAHDLIAAHNQAPSRHARARAAAAVTAARPAGPSARAPLAIDLRLDADLVLPQPVADEAERAAGLLGRLSSLPNGSDAWRAYHQRFYERYGRGALVPLLDVVADSGIGWPDGYPGARPARAARFDQRDEILSALAQRAALDGEREVVLDRALLDALDLSADRRQLPPHLEIGFHLLARTEDALQNGDFRLEVVSASRAAGVSAGRFLHLLHPQHRDVFTELLSALPVQDERAITAQLSFPPLDPASGHVARSVATGQLVVSFGEHRPASEGVLGPEDLAVGCDGRRMYLAVPEFGVRIEAAATHALNPRGHTPPLARLVTELSRAQSAQVTAFSWGAQRSLPFLPRLRHGRVILSRATWCLTTAELPSRSARFDEWNAALSCWLVRRRVPQHVTLTADSQGLPLDLDHPGHRVLLRGHLASHTYAVLVETPAPADLGWAGGRAHEVVVPLTATRTPVWPRLPTPTVARLVRRGHGDAPGASRVLLAALYGDIERQDTVLTRHLPDLLERLGHPAWWFVRFRDPRQHLRLRFAMPDPTAFGPAATVISTWVAELNRAGLLSEVVYPTSYTERGRWGDGPAWAAAEHVFRADSAAVLTHLSQPQRPDRLALLAAHAVAIAAGFTGSSTAGLRWLVDSVPAKSPAAVLRPVFAEAVRLADPDNDWAALRAEPGGLAVVNGWAPRHRALDAYRLHFPGEDTQGVDFDDVLGSLLHCSYVRTARIDFDDEAQVLYLARAAALARLSRNGDL